MIKTITMHKIVPFDKQYQEEICILMDQIQNEFEIPFRNPNGKQISDIADPENLFWVALNENRVVGTIGLTRINSCSGFLRHLFVVKENRGKGGVSQALLDTALAKATELNYESIYLGTMDQFRAAQKFYEKNRFRCIPKETLPAEMPVSPVDTIFYCWKNENA
ncbi:GNAT family N-acetyltransferase [Fluviicola chungangensis]|uniref:GNAT family N-acetyltransferase n=1 Tax=Fluviicola chungangensis TaxID=2597671 RepID=A0A556N758_9FLAO|nr:GNAT family N-acetyltransferase [Fluviicola chungangensis]TSJ47960.1 GNAT family N-acetyltransferase [Fluviicola chungangensis]